MENLSIRSARNLALFAQGLICPPERQAEPDDIRVVLSRLGVIQIDTINIVARSPYFFLWSRLGNYDPDWLNRALEKRQIFEFWAHAASFLPIEDYPLHRRIMLEQNRLPWFQGWYEAHKAEADAVLAHIQENGAVRSADFKNHEEKRGTWWNWKLEKHALEYWFARGDLMISKRVNFQRVYDLRTRVMPDWRDEDAPPISEVYKKLVSRSIASMGLALPGWVPDYFRLPKKEVQVAIHEMIEQKKLVELKIDGWQDSLWAIPEVWEIFRSNHLDSVTPETTTLLTPFDSLIWDRTRTRLLFDFDFSIECYLPAAKRRFGYYLLPILHNGELVGRLDGKADRAAKRFEVKALYLEPRVKTDRDLAKKLASVFSECAAWHKTPDVHITQCEDRDFFNDITTILDSGV